MNKIKRIFNKIFFPTKHHLYLTEEEKNIKQFAMTSKTGFIDPCDKKKIDNIKACFTFYLKHKKTHRVIVVKGNSFQLVKKQYEEKYDFVESLIKDASYEWDWNGNFIDT